MDSLEVLKRSKGFHPLEEVLEVNRIFGYSDRKRNYAALREEFLKRFGSCYWCGIKVKPFKYTPRARVPYNDATLDHVVSKYFRKPGESVLKVLACAYCNQLRSAEEVAKFGQRVRDTTVIRYATH